MGLADLVTLILSHLTGMMDSLAKMTAPQIAVATSSEHLILRPMWPLESPMVNKGLETGALYNLGLPLGRCDLQNVIFQDQRAQDKNSDFRLLGCEGKDVDLFQRFDFIFLTRQPSLVIGTHSLSSTFPLQVPCPHPCPLP